MAASTAFYQSLHFFTDGISYVNELNKSLTEISIVTGQTQQQVAQLGEEYNRLAQSMGVLTNDVARATVEFYRQGLSQEEVMNRTSVATQYAKISALDFKRSAEVLTATVNSMGVDIERASDVFSYLGDATATGADEIGIAFQRVGGTAGAVNLEFEKTASWIAVLSSRTREGAATIGNSIKSILARVQSMREKGFSEEDGTSVNQVAKALNEVDIALMDNEGNFRNFGNVMDELGAKWTSLDSRTKAYLATTIAGTYQQSRFLNLMEGYADTIPLYEKSLKSAGVTQEKFNLYQQGTEAQLNKLKATWEGLWMASFDSETIQLLVSSFNTMATVMKNTVETFGLLPPILGITGVSILAFNGGLQRIIANGALVLATLKGIPLGLRTIDSALAATTLKMNMMSGATRALTISLNTLKTASVTALRFAAGIALPLAAFAGIGLAISKATEALNEYKQKQQEIKKQNEDIRESYTNHGNEIELLVSKYENLNKQVENGSLKSTNEEYVNTANRLNEIFPQVTKHVDAQGNAHLANIDYIKQELDYAKQLKENYEQTQVSNFEDSLEDQRKEFQNLIGMAEQIQNKLNGTTSGSDHTEIARSIKSDEERLQIQRDLIQNEREMQLMLYNSKDYIKDKANAFLSMSGATENLSEESKSLIADFIQEKIALADITKEGFNFQEFLRTTVNEATDLGEKLATVPEAFQSMFDVKSLDGLSNEQLSVLKSINSSVADGYQEWEQYRQVLESVGFKNVDEMIKNLTNGIDGNTKALQDNEAAAKELAESYDNAISNISDLNGIINDLNENHSLSADTIGKIMEKYPHLLAYLNDESTMRQKVAEQISQEEKVAKQAMLGKLQYNQTFYKAAIEANAKQVQTFQKAYGVDLKSYKSLGEAKVAVENKVLGAIAGAWESHTQRLITMTRVAAMTGNPMMQGIGMALGALKDQATKVTADFNDIFLTQIDVITGASIATQGLSNATDKASKSAETVGDSYESARYVSDKFKQALEKINLELERQNQLQSKFPQHSKKYQDSLKKEIDLMKQKKKLLEDQARSLDKQIKSGNIKQTGIIKGSGATGYATGSVTSVSNVSSADLNKYLKGKLSGMGSALIAAGKANGIDPAFLAAIAMHETGNGSSNAIRTKSNAFGIMSSKGGLRSFGSVAESISYTADMLRRLYTSQGLTTVAAIQKKYAPVGVANDPTGLNKNWVNGVNKFWSQFTGTVSSVGASVASSASKSVADYYLKNFRVTSNFNENRGSYNHKGLDLANGRQGDPVKALNGGKVITAAYSKSAGYWVVVQQDDGTVAKYMHMQKGLNVKAGQRVSAGQQLGKVGNTGHSTGAHLHLQIESGGKPVDPKTYMQQLSAVTSSSVADQLQLVDQAKSELIDLKMDALDIENQIAQLQMELINSQLAQFDVISKQIQSHLKIYQANQNKHLESQSEYYRGNLQSQINLLTDQRKLYQDQMKFISDQVRLNKGLTEAQKSELQSKLLDVRDAFYDVHTQVRALEWEKTLASIARYGDEVEKLEYKLRLSKQQQELHNKESQEYIDLQNHQRRYHHDMIVEMEREKAMIDQVRASQNLDERQKKELNDRYLELKVSILQAQEAMQELANEASQLKLDNVLKEIESVSEELDRNLKRIDNSIHMTDSEDEDSILKLNKERLNALLDQRKAILDNIESLNAVRSELAGNDEALKQNAEEIQRWKDALSDIDVSIFDQKETIEDIYESIADSYVEAMKEAYAAEREIKLDQLDEIRKREEKAHNEKMKEFDEQSKAIDDQYNKQLRALDDQEASDDYEKELAKKQSEAQKLQDKINALAMDDSEWANKERLRLEEELAEQLEEIEEFKHDRSTDLRRKALEDERDAKQEQLDKEREMENEAWEDRQEALDKQREQLEQYYEDLLEDEREWARIREDIMNGNIEFYKNKLEEMAKYVTDNGQVIGDSISKNIADALNRAKENISSVTEAIKKLFEEADKTTTNQDKAAEDTANEREDKEDKKPKEATTGKLVIKKPIKLWTRKNGKLEYVRGLNPGEVYKVYGYDDKWGGQYNVGANHWVTNMPEHVQFQKYHDGGIVGGKGSRLTELANKLFNEKPNEQTVTALKRELFAPEKNMPNFFNNIKNFSSSLMPSVQSPSVIYNLNFKIDTLTGDKQGANVLFRETEKRLKKLGKL